MIVRTYPERAPNFLFLEREVLEPWIVLVVQMYTQILHHPVGLQEGRRRDQQIKADSTTVHRLTIPAYNHPADEFPLEHSFPASMNNPWMVGTLLGRSSSAIKTNLARSMKSL